MSILERLSSRGLRPIHVSAAKGGEYACPCPGCGGTDRFHAFPEQEGGPICQEAGAPGTYWCRKCGAGGDMLQFLLDFEGLTFADACEELGAKAPRKLQLHGRLPQPPKPSQTPAFVPAELAVPSEVWRARAARLVEKCHARLLETPRALAWLSGRGLDLDAVRRYRLGYLAEEQNKAETSTGIFRARSAWGLPDKEIKNQDGSLTIKKQLWIPRGIVIPAYGPEGPTTATGEAALPIRLRIRRPDADTEGTNYPKYHVLPGSGMAPMLLGSGSRAIVVVEAELDAMLVHHLAGDKAGALAVLTNLGKPDAAAFAALGRAITVLVALDYDKAGADGWTWWREHCATARRWPVPEGKDPGDAFKLGEDLRAWVLAGLPALLRNTPAPVAAPLGESLSGAVSSTGEGAQGAPAAQGGPEPTPPSTAPAAPAPAPQGPSTGNVATPPIIQRVAQLYALRRLAAFMSRTGVTYGPDSTGCRAWLFPPSLSAREVDALFDELLPLVPNDVYELVTGHPDLVVSSGNLCAPYQPQRRTS